MNVFICHTPLYYYLFKNIYMHLPNSYFAIPPMYDREFESGLGGGMSGNGYYSYVRTFLENKSVKLINYGSINKNNFISYLQDNATNIIMAHVFNGVEQLDKVNIIRMMYSMGLYGIEIKLTDYTFKCNEYIAYYFSDLILTYGDRYADHLKRQELNAIAVGNPIFDSWFKDGVDKTGIDILKRRICKEKKNILYLPTHNISSSIDYYYDSIRKLASEYNVIIKLHHATFRNESDRVCKMITDPNLVVLADCFDPLPLYKIADVVIVDGVSGTLFDAILTKKPIVSIGTSLGKYEMIAVDKDELFIPRINSPGDLERAIKNVIDTTSTISDRALDYLFYQRDGNAGERAAKAILENARKTPLAQIEKFNRGIRNAPDCTAKEEIVKMRDRYLSTVKTRMSSRVHCAKKRLSKILNSLLNT